MLAKLFCRIMAIRVAGAERFSGRCVWFNRLKRLKWKLCPEGRRGSHAVKVYSDTELLMVDQGTGAQADQFDWLGKRYEIVAADAYQCGVINHWRMYAVEVRSH